MEENLLSTHSKLQNFQLSPMKNVKNSISDLVKSGVADAPLVSNRFTEDKSVLQDRNKEDDLVSRRFHLEENGKKAELCLLFEKDLSEIDFDISKDVFDDIKIKEGDVTGLIENVPSLVPNDKENDINFKLPFFNKNDYKNVVISLNSKAEQGFEKANSEIEQGFKKVANNSTTIPSFVEVLETISSETEKISEDKVDKNEVHTNSCDEIKRIMEELQATSLLHLNNQCSKDYLVSNSNKFVSNISLNFQDPGPDSESDTKKCEDLVSDDIENISSSALESATVAKNINISNNDSIQDVIESVIQASVKQDNETCLLEQEEVNKKHCEKKPKLDLLTESKGTEKKTYGAFEVIVPLIGKNVLKTENDVPFTHRYDLAIKRNAMRAKFQKNDPNFPIPSMSFEEWRKRRELRSPEEIAAEERKKVEYAVELAKCFTKLAIKILSEYEKDEPSEATIIKYFRYFEFAPASPLSLLYAPHFVHTMMLCRGDEDLSPNLRRAANECFDKCHALFPIPEGYNFETVYTSEVKKYVPKEFDHLDDLELNYGDYDSSDFEDVASGCSTDSDKEWE